MTKRQRIIIFDFDGVICDSFQQGIEVLRALSKPWRFSYLRDEDIEKVRTLSARETLKFLGISFWKTPLVVRALRGAMQHRLPTIDPVSGISQAIADLKAENNLIGIVSSNSEANITAFLKQHAIAVDFVAGGIGLFGKAKVLRKLKAKFERQFDQVMFFYVGDEGRDIEAARSAGIPPIGVTWGYNTAAALEKEGPSMVLTSPSELLTLGRLQTATRARF